MGDIPKVPTTNSDYGNPYAMASSPQLTGSPNRLRAMQVQLNDVHAHKSMRQQRV